MKLICIKLAIYPETSLFPQAGVDSAGSKQHVREVFALL